MKPILRALVLGAALLGSLRMSGQISTVVETIPTGTVCTGSEFTFVFTANDTRSNDNKYNVYIYRSSYEPGSGGVDFGQAIQVASNVGAFSAAAGGGRNRRTATVQFDPEELASGSYKIWIFAQTSDSRATRSGVFSLSAAPTLSITGLATTPLYGQAARIRFTFSGNGGYSFAHRTNLVDDILPFRSNPPNPFDFDFSLGTRSSYYYDEVDVIQFKGTCGSGKSTGIVSGGTLISAQNLSITFGSISQPGTCPGSGITVPFSVNGVPPSGTKYRLEFSDSNGSFSNPRTVATVTGTGSPLAGNTPSDYAPGTGYKLRIVPDNFNINTSIAVNVTLTRPAPPDAQTSYAYCPGENPTQLSASGQNLRWYNDAAELPGAPTPPKDVTSSYNVTQTKDGCQSNFTTIRISIKPKSDRPNPGNRDYCQNEQANTLSELTGGAANPKWFDSNDNELSSNFRPNTGEVGTKTYRVSQQYNDCRSDKAEFSIRVKPRPGAPGVKSAEPVCQLTSVSNALLQAAVTSGNNNLRWYETEQGGGGSDQPPTPRTGNAGLQNYFVSQTDQGCEGPRAKIEQEVKPAPVLPGITTNPVLRCLNEGVTTLTASGSGLRWYRQANGGNSEASIAIATDRVRTDTYYVTQTGSNGCESGRQAVEVRVNPKSDPPAVSNREYCRNDPAKPLSESASTATRPTWFDDGSGTELSGDFKPNTGEVGTKTYRVSQEYNGCRSDPAKFNIRVKPIPSSPTTQKAPDICQLLQRPNAEIAASAQGEALRWYETEQGGTGNANAPTPRTTSAGLQTYFVTRTVEGCESPRAKVEQTVLPAPVLPTLASNPVLRCIDEAVTMLTASGSGLRWYRQANGGNSEASIAIATNQVRTDTYYVTQTGTNGCESGRQAVEVRVLARPTAPEVSATSFVCQFSKPLALKATGLGLLWSGSGITGSTETPPTPSTDAPATFSYQVVQRVGACVGPAASITYTIRPAPVVPGVQSPLNLCRNAPARDLSANGERLKWYQTTDRSDPPKDRVNFNPTTPGTTRFYVSQSDNFSCESQNSPLDVRVLLQAAARLTGDSLVFPSDSSAIRVRLTGDAPFTMTLWNGRTVTTSAKPYIVWVKTQVDASYQLRALSNDCGPGEVGNKYLLRVQKPLGTEPGTPGGEVISLRTYPNPATESANLAWQAPARAVVQLRLSDLGGRTVWHCERTSTGTVETEALPLRGLPAGLYLIQLLDGQNNVVTRRILKN